VALTLKDLVPMPVAEDADNNDDRIVLPESALTELNTIQAQSGIDVWGNGPLIFELSVRILPTAKQYYRLDGTGAGDAGEKDSYILVTHCGVREFSAPEGTVKLPQKVINSIFSHLPASSSVVVDDPSDRQTSLSLHEFLVSLKYVRLPKVTSVTFRPEMNDNSTHYDILALGPVKQCLEENLRKHLTLTVGDKVKWMLGIGFETVLRISLLTFCFVVFYS
jgi:hypothetical protein